MLTFIISLVIFMASVLTLACAQTHRGIIVAWLIFALLIPVAGVWVTLADAVIMSYLTVDILRTWSRRYTDRA